MKTTWTVMASAGAFVIAAAIGACIGGPGIEQEQDTAALEGAYDDEGSDGSGEEGGGDAAFAGDLCPNQQNTLTVCPGQALCSCAGARYITTGPCHDSSCYRTDVKNATDACNMARQEVPDPPDCPAGCTNGAVGGPNTSQAANGCCTATKVRGCQTPPRVQ